ncbi:hypothetical protein [Herbidospora sp. RD11066]
MSEDPQKPRNHLRAVPPPPEDTPPADPPGEAFGSPGRNPRRSDDELDDPATGEIPRATGMPFPRRTGESGLPTIGDPARVASWRTAKEAPKEPAPEPPPVAEEPPPAPKGSGLAPDESDPFGAMLRDLDKGTAEPQGEQGVSGDSGGAGLSGDGGSGGRSGGSGAGDAAGWPASGEPASRPQEVDPATARLREGASELPRRIPKSSGRRREDPAPSSPSDRPGWFETPASQPRTPEVPQTPQGPGQVRPPALFGAPIPGAPPEGRSDFRDFGRPDVPGRGGGPVPQPPADQKPPGANGVSPVGDGGFSAFTAHRSPQHPSGTDQPWPSAGPDWPGAPEPPTTQAPSPNPGWPGPQDHSWPGADAPAAGGGWPGMSPHPSGMDASPAAGWPGVEPRNDGPRPAPGWPGAESPPGGALWPGTEPRTDAPWAGTEPRIDTPPPGPQWPGTEFQADAPSAGAGWPGTESQAGAQWPGTEPRGDVPRPGQEGPPDARLEASGLTAPGSAWSTPSDGTVWPPPHIQEPRSTPEVPGPHGHVPRGSERWRGPAAEPNQPVQGPWPSTPAASPGPEGTAVLFQPQSGGSGGDAWQGQDNWQQPNSGPWQGTTQPGWAQPPGPPRKNRWLWPLIAAVVVLVVAGGTFVFFQNSGGETPQSAPPPKAGASPEASGAAPAAPAKDPKGTDVDVCAMLDPEQTERLVPGAKIDMRMSDERDGNLVSYVRWTCDWTNRSISFGEFNRQRQITINVARYEAIGDTTADKAATIQFDGQKRQWEYTASVSNEERYYSKPEIIPNVGDAAIAQYQWTREDDYRYAFGTGFGRVGNITFEVKYEASQQHKEADVLTNDTKQSITEENAIREIKGLLNQLAQSAGAWYAGKPLPFEGKARPTAEPTPSPSPVKIALPPNCVAVNQTAGTLVPNTEGLAQSLTEGKAKLTECQWWNDAMPVEGGKVRWRNLRIGIREFPNSEMARFYLVDERGKSRGTASSKIGGIQWGKVQKLPNMGTDNYGQAVKQQTETAYSGAYEIKVMQDKFVITVLFGGADRPSGTEINNTEAVLMPLQEAAAGAKAMATGLLATL